MLRLRIPELMRDHGIENAYQLIQRSDGCLTPTTAYHLVRTGGVLTKVDLRTIACLLQTFNLDLKDAGKLFVDETPESRPRRSKRKS